VNPRISRELLTHELLIMLRCSINFSDKIYIFTYMLHIYTYIHIEIFNWKSSQATCNNSRVAITWAYKLISCPSVNPQRYKKDFNPRNNLHHDSDGGLEPFISWPRSKFRFVSSPTRSSVLEMKSRKLICTHTHTHTHIYIYIYIYIYI